MITDKNTIQEFKEAENILATLKLSDVRIPKFEILLKNLEKPVSSPYVSKFSLSFQQKIVGLVMAIPVVAAAFAVIFSFGNSGSVYLAQNDENLQQVNVRIMDNINALEQLSE